MARFSGRKLLLVLAALGLVFIFLAGCSNSSRNKRTVKNVRMSNRTSHARLMQNQSMTTKKDTVTYRIIMKDFAFVPNKLKLPTNKPVKLIFKNTANIVHAFMAGKDGVRADKKGFKKSLFQGVNVKHHGGMYGTNPSVMIGVKPHKKASITFTLPASDQGSWKFGCFKKIGNKTHYSMGMKGEIYVK